MSQKIKLQGLKLPDNRFISLGELSSLNGIPIEKKQDKVWATLGWESDKPFTPKGEIVFSEKGDETEGKKNKLTRQEVENLRELDNELKITRNSTVRELFINLDDVDYSIGDTFNPLELPRLRLSLNLKSNEGAIVYYQHSKKGDYNDDEAISEYIFSEEGEEDEKANYFFAIEPKKELKLFNEAQNLYTETTVDSPYSFIIKVLVFKRTKKSIRQDLEKLKVGKERYELLLYNIADNKKCEADLNKVRGRKDVADVKKKVLIKTMSSSFQKAIGPLNKVRIDPTKKTLLLLHGTFVDSTSSFVQLMISEKTQKPVLTDLIESGHFEQIIALDHPTVLHDAKSNAEWLAQTLKERNIKFTQPVSLLTSSRGGMLGEYLVVHDTVKKYIPLIDNVLMFSPGNGCGYFTKAQNFSKGMNASRLAIPFSNESILILMKLGIKAILQLPGFKMMTKGSPTHRDILQNTKIAYPEAKFSTVIADWDKSLIERSKVLKRAFASGVDIFTKASLGKENDWVIGVDVQSLMPKNAKRGPLNNGIEKVYSIHGKYFDPTYVQNRSNKNWSPRAHIKTIFPK